MDQSSNVEEKLVHDENITYILSSFWELMLKPCEFLGYRDSTDQELAKNLSLKDILDS